MSIRTYYDAATEELVAAAIRVFRALPRSRQAELLDAERPASGGPNLCGEIPLANPCLEIDLGPTMSATPSTPCTIGVKEPGQRAYEAFQSTSRVPANWWRSMHPDTKAQWVRVEKELEPVFEPVVADDCHLSLDELTRRMQMVKGRWRFATGDDLVAFTNLPEQALACILGMKAEIAALEAQFASDPDHKPLSEPDAFKIEAAMQYGFIPHDDDATIYRATEQQIVNLMDAARKQGLDDAIKTLTEKSNG